MMGLRNANANENDRPINAVLSTSFLYIFFNFLLQRFLKIKTVLGKFHVFNLNLSEPGSPKFGSPYFCLRALLIGKPDLGEFRPPPPFFPFLVHLKSYVIFTLKSI